MFYKRFIIWGGDKGVNLEHAKSEQEYEKNKTYGYDSDVVDSMYSIQKKIEKFNSNFSGVAA